MDTPSRAPDGSTPPAPALPSSGSPTERPAPRPGWALVLGASSGFGAAASLALASAGLDVVGVHLDRRATLARAAAVQAGVRARGRRCQLFNLNATEDSTRAAVLDWLAGPEAAAAGDADLPSSGPGVRLLLHSLAFGSLGPLIGDDGAALTPRQLTMTLEVMAHSLVWWTRDLLHRGLLGPGSRVLAMTSSGSTRVLPGYGGVGAAKAALESHVRTLAVELAPRRVTVNALRAGVTDTPALRLIPGAEELLAEVSRRHPAGRATRVEDVAGAVTALLDPGFDWVTGNVIGVDGGEALPA